MRVKSDEDIKKELISKDLNELIKPLLIFVVLTILFGYAGYVYSVDNNLDIKHGIIFGSLFPLGIALIKVFDIENSFIYIAYTITYICISDYIPTFVGIIILFIIITLFLISFIYLEKKDRTEEIKTINYNESKIIHPVPNVNTQTSRTKYFSEINNDINEEVENDIFDEEEKLDYECELCFKKISYEEYELYDGYCEECFMDVHMDDKGNYHDEEIL